MKVAVIGSGLSGLTCAWALSSRRRPELALDTGTLAAGGSGAGSSSKTARTLQSGHSPRSAPADPAGQIEVWLFEKANHHGMDAHALDFQWGGQTHRIDVPLRAFYESYYPNLTKLYKFVGAEVQRVDYSANFNWMTPGEGLPAKDNYRADRMFFRFANFFIGTKSYSYSFNRAMLGKKARRILFDYYRFLRKGPKDIESMGLENKTIAEYIALGNYSHHFYQDFLRPVFTAVCTCSNEEIDSYPADLIINFVVRGFAISGVQRLRYGTQSIVSKLTEDVSREILQASVKEVYLDEEGRPVVVNGSDKHVFDYVVMATQAHKAADLLGRGFTAERELLSTFSYAKSSMTMHTDARVMPAKKSHWSPINYVLATGPDAPDYSGQSAMASIWMNKVQDRMNDLPPVFQSWNPLWEHPPGTLIARAEFDRPVITLEAQSARAKLRRLNEEQGRRVLFCGSYAGEGIPLLEQAATTAVRAADIILENGLPSRRPVSAG